MMKAGAVGRLGNVTKLLQRQRRKSQWRMQAFVNRGAFPPFSEEVPTGSEVRGCHSHPLEIFEISRVVIAVEKLPRRRRRKKCDASTSQSDNFGVSLKRFKSSTPGSSIE